MTHKPLMTDEEWLEAIALSINGNAAFLDKARQDAPQDEESLKYIQSLENMISRQRAHYAEIEERMDLAQWQSNPEPVEIEFTLGRDVSAYASFKIMAPRGVTKTELIKLAREKADSLVFKPDWQTGEGLRIVCVNAADHNSSRELFENIPIDQDYSNIGHSFQGALGDYSTAAQRMVFLLDVAHHLKESKPELARRLLDLFEDKDALQVLRDVAVQEDKPALAGPRP